MKCPYVIKKCKKCKELLVAYEGNFYYKSTGKYKLEATCIRCKINYQRKYYNKNKDELNKNKKQYLKEYYKKNKNKILENQERYRKDNPEKCKESRHKYYEKNKEKERNYSKQYVKENPDKVFNKNNKRRQLEENQGSGVSKEQWLEMMEFFNWRCAYSGEVLGENRTIDHIIPLNNGGKHEVWNCVPMIKKYNISKFTNDMVEWYKKQEYFSEERLNKIYEWIEYAKNKYQ